MDLPFEKTPFKESPYKKDIEVRDPHNNFLGVLFNQGIVGFILYLALLIIATKTFWSNANSPCNLKNYILISCTSVLIGTYFIHGLSEVLKFRYLTLILGIGIAAQNLKCEDTVQ
jgi:O-antigen ligase